VAWAKLPSNHRSDMEGGGSHRLQHSKAPQERPCKIWEAGKAKKPQPRLQGCEHGQRNINCHRSEPPWCPAMIGKQRLLGTARPGAGHADRSFHQKA